MRKSIYLLCEYGISYHTIIMLEKNDITFSDILFSSEVLFKFWNKNSKRAQEILDAAKIACESEKNNSIFELTKYGLSASNINALYSKKIEMDQLKYLDFNEIQTITGFNTPISQKLFNIINKIKEEKNIVEIDKRYPEFILNLIKQNGLNDFNIEEINKIIKEEKLKYSCDFLQDDLNDLVIAKKITINKNSRYSIFIPTLIESIESLENEKNENAMYIVLEKLNGRTLESIGQDLGGITRERIRQIFVKNFSKLGNVKEDEFKDLFQKYDFSSEIFCKLFNVDNTIYNYLKEKYKKGDTDIIELLDTDLLNLEQIELIKKKYKLISFNNEDIVANKKSLFEAILKKENRYITIEELTDIYNEVILELNSNYFDFIDIKKARNNESILSRSNKVIFSINRKFRYYNLNLLSKENIEKLKNMLYDLNPGAYSTEYLYRNNPIFFENIDINDAYEVHNILRQLNNNSDIKFSRMPDILVKCDDKFKFVESLIDKYSPMKIDEFVELVSVNYGHRQDTFRALLSQFSQFISGDIISNKYKIFSEIELEKIKNHLVKDIYSIVLIKKVFLKILDFNEDEIDEYINSLNMYNLGYKLRGNYIIKNNIGTLEEYFEEEVTNQEFYEINDDLRSLNASYFNFIHRMMYDMKIFKINDKEYITLKGLEKKGISLDYLKELRKKIVSYFNDEEYFNLYQVKKNINFEDIYMYDLNDEFIESLILSDPDISRVAILNNKVFIKTENEVTKEIFIGSIIEKFKSIKVEEIDAYLNRYYNIDLETYEIKANIDKNKYYYKEGTSEVFIDYDYYLKTTHNDIDFIMSLMD